MSGILLNNKLDEPCLPLEFLSEIGVDRSIGDPIIAELKQVLLDCPELSAVAAPQIGKNYRIFCIRFNDVIKTFINPIIKKKKGQILTAETCGSFPETEFLLKRPEELEVIYYTDNYQYEDNKLLFPASGLFDQQAQLLDGITPMDVGIPYALGSEGSLKTMFADISATLLDEEATTEEKEMATNLYKDFEAIYAQFAAKKIAEATESLTEEEALEFKKLKFTEDVINGRTQVIAENEGAKLNREQRRQLQFGRGPKKTIKQDPADKLNKLRISNKLN